MALSNILREPRREITETIIGLLIVAGPFWADYQFGIWFSRITYENPTHYCPVPIGMIIGVVIVFILGSAVLFIHELGNKLCEIIEKHGLQIRPNERY